MFDFFFRRRLFLVFFLISFPKKKKKNQQEIVEYTSADETAVCNLASIALPRFVRERGAATDAASSSASGRVKLTGSLDAASRFFDFDKLRAVTRVVARNLNKIIDINYYPVETARNSNLRHRPIGIGVQGLADAFILLGLPFDSEGAKQLNREIFEAIYFSALEESCALAEVEGPYSTYEGSPASKGVLQHDMWGITEPASASKEANGERALDWAGLRAKIAQHGLRNSLLVAPMPTASTSQILGNNECFEPYTSNIYVRRVLSGEFTVVNQHLLTDLTRLGLWSADVKNQLVAANGSVADLPDVPDSLRDLYKTVWEIKQRSLVDMAADRGAYIDQSQSFNVHMQDANFGKLTSLHFYAWKAGLKTGMYYLRTRAAADAIKFTVDQQALARSKAKARDAAAKMEAAKEVVASAGGKVVSEEEGKAKSGAAAVDEDMEREAKLAAMVCSLENKDECLMCGS